MDEQDERLQILKMIETGAISADEGVKLLKALDDAAEAEASGPSGRRPKWFRVHVTDLTTGKRKVNVNIPIGLVNVGMRLGARFAPQMDDMDLSEIMKSINEGTMGKIIDVEDAEDGERVEIFVE
ncbi:MAG: SHOCT-like domain-containing protein [Anaerolineae bacterium]